MIKHLTVECVFNYNTYKYINRIIWRGNMNGIQIIAISEIIIFYSAYLFKMMIQRKKGIQTSQLGIGDKLNRTLRVEKTLQVASYLIIPAELISIFLNTNWFCGTFVRYIGLVLAFFGVVFFITAMVTMRDSWRAGISAKDETDIVTNGIYKISRNPAFLGFDLTYLGFFIAFDNLLLLAVSLFVIIAMHKQILEEEKFMETTFGESYLEYKKEVGRYIFL